MKRGVLLALVVAIATVFLLSLGAGTVRAQAGSGGAQDQPAAPAWRAQMEAADIMISEAEKTIKRCNEEIARAQEMKRIAQEGMAKAAAAGGTKEDRPAYPWVTMDKAADKMIADALQTIERCELQIKTGRALRTEAENELKKIGQ
jgi:hypothetical protein